MDFWSGISTSKSSSPTFGDEARVTNAFEQQLERARWTRRTSRPWTSESSSDSSLSEHLDKLYEEYRNSFRGAAESPPVSSSFIRPSGSRSSPSSTQDDDDCMAFEKNGTDFEYCPPNDQPNFSVLPIRRKKNKKPLATECVFCKNNEVDEKLYKSHILKDEDGRTICPVLRKYKCPTCGVDGDQAHTLKYCPLKKISLPL